MAIKQYFIKLIITVFALCCLVFFWLQTLPNYAVFFAYNLFVVFLGLRIFLSFRNLNFLWLNKYFLLGCGLFLMGFTMIYSIVLLNKDLGRTIILDYWALFLIGYVFAVAINYDKTYSIRWLFSLLIPYLILAYGFSNISTDWLSLIIMMSLVFLSAFGTTKLFGFIEKRN